jgi:putative SOS response-associated peptidase YedK
MPVILSRDNYDMCLDPDMTNADVLSDLLKPFDAHTMREYPVSGRINQVANDDEACSMPIEVAEAQTGLF